MKTVKEISHLTGISVRALHYYDEIELLKPTAKSETGYRLYDDKALETLRQILFFREFDIPLKEIKKIMDNPALDQSQILLMQRQMLTSKIKRLERLVASIDDILKGEDKMDFAIFNQNEIETIYDSMVSNMSEEQKAIFIKEHGSMEAFHDFFMKSASSREAQDNFRKIIEWYGSKENAMEASLNPHDSQLVPLCQKRMQEVLKSLAEKRELEVHSPEVMALVKEYEAISREMYQMEDVSGLLLELAELYKTNRQAQEATDSIYGKGATEFWGRALETFCKNQTAAQKLDRKSVV